MLGFAFLYLVFIQNWYFTVPVIIGLFLLTGCGYREGLVWIFVVYMFLIYSFNENTWKAFLIMLGIELAMFVFAGLSGKGTGAAYYVPYDFSDAEYGPGDPEFDIDNDMDNGSGYGGEDEDF